MVENRKVKLINQIAYGCGDLYGGGSFFLISTFSMFFFINVAGLSPLWAGLVPGLGKIWDAVSDPLMGYITDKTKSKFGRRRIFFLIAIIPIIISSTLIWLPVSFDNQAITFFFYFMVYLLFYTISTMTLVPYAALCSEMSLDFSERNRLSGTRMVFSVLSTMIIALFAQRIINIFPDQRTGHLMMGFASSLMFAIPWIFVFLGTWELPYVEHSDQEKIGIIKNFLSIFRNGSFRVHIIMYICAYSTMDIVLNWLKFYMTDYLHKPDLLSLGLPIIILIELLFLPIYVMIANRKSHSFALIIGLFIWGIATFLFNFHTPLSSNILVYLNCFLIGAGLSSAVVMPWSMLPFVTDVDILITAKKRAGTYAGAMTLTRKLIQGALVLPLMGLILKVIDYQTPTQAQIQAKAILTQSPETLAKMKFMFIVMPLTTIIIGIIASLFFKINKNTHTVLMNEIERLDKGGKKEDVTPETKKVCEMLTGMKYEKLYK